MRALFSTWCASELLHADALLIDEFDGRQAVQQRHLLVTGTLGVLAAAHGAGMLDFDTALAALRRTNFYVSDNVVQGLRQRIARVKQVHPNPFK